MSMPDTSSELKIVIVGDGAVRNRHYNNKKEILVSLQVGKTCFCTVFAKKEFPSGYVPTIFESHPVKRILNGKVCWLKESIREKMICFAKEYTITVWDTAGQEDFDHIRR